MLPSGQLATVGEHGRHKVRPAIERTSSATPGNVVDLDKTNDRKTGRNPSAVGHLRFFSEKKKLSV